MCPTPIPSSVKHFLFQIKEILPIDLKKKAEMHADTLLCFESLSSVFLTFIFIDMKSNSPMGIETRSFCVLHRAPLSETEKNQASNIVA